MADWAEVFRLAGQALGLAAREGTLRRGFREVISYVPNDLPLDRLEERRRVRIEMDDASRTQPHIRTPDHTGGRGLILIDRLASSWGVDNHADHKRCGRR